MTHFILSGKKIEVNNILIKKTDKGSFLFRWLEK